MSKIITIGREYGSGGRLIGRRVADALGIPFYDKELIPLIAKESGYDIEFVESTGEYSTANNFLLNFAVGGIPNQSTYSETYMSISDQLHILQNKIIREIAEKGPCVFVGRSADYILRERDDCLNTFICADLASKVSRAVRYYGLALDKAEKALKKKDKARANHYNHYTGSTWGKPTNYHLCLNSGLLGLEGCVETILAAAKLPIAKEPSLD